MHHPSFQRGMSQFYPAEQLIVVSAGPWYTLHLRLPDGRPVLFWVLVLVGACQSGTVWAGLCLIHHHHVRPDHGGCAPAPGVLCASLWGLCARAQLGCAPGRSWVVVWLGGCVLEAQMAVACITARAENPRGRKLWLRLKEFVRRAKLDPSLWGQYSSSRCHGGGSERKTALHATDSPSRDSSASSAACAHAVATDRAACSTRR